MDKLQDLLNERISGPSSKVKALAKQSTSGNLTGIHGLFGSKDLSDKEKNAIEQILFDFRTDDDIDIANDMTALISITSEVKAITNQAAILHGERIKRAQSLLKKYREGAFTAWLVSTYGNRQTPYNLLLYYEFHESLPQEFKLKLENMPRQAIYVLAARQAPFERKQKIVARYNGETKQEMLELIRKEFPLSEDDKRKQDVTQSIITNIEKQIAFYQKFRSDINSINRHDLIQTVKKLLLILENTK